MAIDYYTQVPLFIEMYLEEDSTLPIATGTGFSIQVEEQHYLITNWHCVTGRNAETNAPIDGGPCDPKFIKVWFHSDAHTLGTWRRKNFQLKNAQGQKLWIEHPTGRAVDVIALPYTLPADVHAFNLIFEHANADLRIYPSKAVSIIGFPNGLAAGGKFPIWKKGHIASEFDIDYNGTPAFLIDATTRKGMSGSPVVLKESGLVEMASGLDVGAQMWGGTHYKFLGTYSGRLDGDSEIGRVWKPRVINEIIQNQNSLQ